MGTNVSEEPASSIFRVEDGDSNVGTARFIPRGIPGNLLINIV
jgi:hypothetical protein